MKFLHLADLHLGKLMHDLSLLSDQAFILDRILSIASMEKPDAVLIAGDVYQRSAPQAEAMALFDRFVSGLAEKGIRVFIISGNHDSALRISYFSSLIRSSGVFVSEAFDGILRYVSMQDEYGEIRVYLMPFLRPSQVRRAYPDAEISTFQDAVGEVLRRTEIDPEKRNILICHQFITGSETSDSEDLSVGTLENIDASLFDAFDYVALGHIHRPQIIRRDTLRYAGSPLAYSFSEAGQPKSVPVVTMLEKGHITVDTVPLAPQHPVRCLSGTLDELMQMPYSEDYLWITLHDELVPPDARVTLSVNYPNMMKYSVSNSKTRFDMDAPVLQRLENKSIPDLFSDFYRLQNNMQEPTGDHLRILNRVLRELEENP